MDAQGVMQSIPQTYSLSISLRHPSNLPAKILQKNLKRTQNSFNTLKVESFTVLPYSTYGEVFKLYDVYMQKSVVYF